MKRIQYSTYIISKKSIAIQVTASFNMNKIRKSRNSASNLFHRAGTLHSIPGK